MLCIRAGASFAVVSDAGTPGISDPGMQLAEMCHVAGVRSPLTRWRSDEYEKGQGQDREEIGLRDRGRKEVGGGERG